MSPGAPLRLFLDSNVLTAGIVSSWGLDKAVLSLCAARICRLVLADIVREEVEENLLAHASEVKNKRYREGLLANMEPARRSRELARIRTDVPVEFKAEELRYRAGSREAAFAIFNELGFRALAKEYAPTAGTIATHASGRSGYVNAGGMMPTIVYRRLRSKMDRPIARRSPPNCRRQNPWLSTMASATP